jgi:hypothetical protein
MNKDPCESVAEQAAWHDDVPEATQGTDPLTDELTAMTRGGLVVFLLAKGGRLTTRQLAERCGLSRRGAAYMMDQLSYRLPILQDWDGKWYLDLRAAERYLP